MKNGIDKDLLVRRLREILEADLLAITAGQKEAQAGATHQEARQEGDKDMRSTEVSYLARGLAKRVTELRAAIAQLASFKPRRFADDAAVGLGALVHVESEFGDEKIYLLAPCGGGATVELDDVMVSVLTTSAPLGRALLGKQAGDEIELRTPQGRKLLTIAEVA